MLSSEASTSPIKRTSTPRSPSAIATAFRAFGYINPYENFATVLHGSSSCGEDRLGHSEQPSKAQCRASQLGSADIRSYTEAGDQLAADQTLGVKELDTFRHLFQRIGVEIEHTLKQRLVFNFRRERWMQNLALTYSQDMPREIAQRWQLFTRKSAI